MQIFLRRRDVFFATGNVGFFRDVDDFGNVERLVVKMTF